MTALQSKRLGKWGQGEMEVKWENGTSVQILTECRGRILEKQALRPLAEKRVLDTWEKMVNFTKNE